MAQETYVAGAGATARAAAGEHATRFFGPLWERFRLGEGLLLAVNAAVIGFGAHGALDALWRMVVSIGVLAAAYSFNDYQDARADRANPKKNQQLVGLLLERRTAFGRLLLAAHLLLVAIAWIALDPTTAAAAAAMLAVNLLYSVRAKGTPFADVVVVVLWGALFTAIAGASLGVCALVGALTLLMHIFQMHVDLDVDAGNAVRTTAVALRRPTALVAAACVAVGSVLFALLGPFWAASAAFPLLAQAAASRTETAWMLSRAYAGVVLLAVLGALPGAS